MKARFFKWWIVRALALLLAASAASAQERVPFRQEELDQMLAPIALYPDSLLSQMLMASTYPLEVVQAARWSRANPGLSGEDAVRAVEPMDWDPSVKSLAAFPRVLTMMDEKLEWTERLGEAFLAQQAEVMYTIQGLRRRAEAAGNLRPHEQMRVAREGEVIVIDPPAPGVVFVPYYDPLVVYGPWWWPLYPPVYWAPPPHYVVAVHRPSFAWGSGIVISAGFFFGRFDWPHRHVTVVHAYHHRPDVRPVHVQAVWRHDPAHRRGAPFRHAVRPWSEPARSGGNGPSRDAAPAERRFHNRPVDSRTAAVSDNRPRFAPPAGTRVTAPALRIAPPSATDSRARSEAPAIRQPARTIPPRAHPAAGERAPGPRTMAGASRPAARVEGNRQREVQFRRNGHAERRRPVTRDNNRGA